MTAPAAEKEMPKRVQRKRTKGFKLPERTLCVTRPSVFCNPYPLKAFGDLALPLFRNTIRGVWEPSLLDGKAQSFRNIAYDLHHEWLARFRGKHPLDALRETLPRYEFVACWCPLGQPCHADILLELANQ